MKRTADLPVPREAAYRALTDPILLAGWLNVPYASTGHGELHLFELEDWRSPTPWKVRGFIIENVRGDRLTIEKDEIGTHEKPMLHLSLSDAPEGCALELEWDSPYFEPVIRELRAPEGLLRLRLLAGKSMERPVEAAG